MTGRAVTMMRGGRMRREKERGGVGFVAEEREGKVVNGDD